MTKVTTSSTVSPADRAAWVRERLAEIPRTGGDIAANRAARVALDRLADELCALPDRPTIKDEWNGTMVKMLGIRTTSTSGLHGALDNWIAKATA